MAKQKLYHYIYKTTCQVTGKFYVGMHSTDNLEDGYLGSGKILGYSRHKYGDENHTKEILFYCSSRDELKQKEREIVNEDLLKDPLNINLKYGGDGGFTSKMSKAGWLSDDRRKSTSIRLKSQWEDSDYRSKISEQLRANTRASHVAGKLKYDNFTGKTHSLESRAKISIANSTSQLGERNSQFGSCWVTDGVKPIKIKKEQLEEYLSNGYSRGRKLDCKL